MLPSEGMILNVGVVAADTVLGAGYIEEMWTDQTLGAPQLSSPYPHQPEHNNPYDAETIYYGLGSWLDVYNPQTEYQEQISGAGAFGNALVGNRRESAGESGEEVLGGFVMQVTDEGG